jgi:ATP-binding cassette subfamily B protein/ATP-binding cassette subfamily C protein
VAKLQAVVEPASAVALQGSFVLVLGIGGARLASGAITLGDLVAFLLYLLYLSFPLVLVFTSVTDLQQGMAAVARIKEVLAAPPEPATIVAPRERFEAPRSEAPAVRFDSVTFGYGPERRVLRDVSFEIQRFSRTALVGSSGAGKCTVFALLERFYEADSGAFLLDGVDRAVPLDELRNIVGYVEQDSPVMAAPSVRTCSTPIPGRPKRSSRRSWISPACARSSSGSRGDSKRRSGTAGSCSRGASASASPSPACSSYGPGCCCSTR